MFSSFRLRLSFDKAIMDKGPKPTDSTSQGVLNSTIYGLLNTTFDWSAIEGGPIKDEDEYMKVHSKWDRIKRIYSTMHFVNYAIAVILAALSILVLVTIRNPQNRDKSIMWYLYHMISLTVVLLVFHTLALFTELSDSEGVCLFVVYGLEYIFFGFAATIILANAEIFFTVVLPLESWRTKHFLRFIVSMLSGWIVVCLIVAHLIIDNNDARGSDSYCYYSTNETIRDIRFAIRAVLPSIIGFLVTCVSIFIYVMKRFRIVGTNTSETLKEIVFSNERDEVEWIRFSACLNSLFVLRVITWGVLKLPAIFENYDTNIYLIVVLISIHVQSLNLLPIAMFCIPEVRKDIKDMCVATVKFISRGRFGSRGDRETLTVSFGNINAQDA